MSGAEIGAFLFFTVVLGGVAAWASGRAAAITWRPPWMILPYAAMLACAVRFLHYALAGDLLLDPLSWLASFAVLLAGAAIGYRSARANQMTTQYSWLYARTSPFAWRASASAPSTNSGA
jgi:hypothetical protein